MNIFGLGLPEIIVILVVALLIFGPKKLPEIGKSLGKAIRGFQEASRDFEQELKREVEILEKNTATTLPADKPAIETTAPNAIAATPEKSPEKASTEKDS
jgi:sec-independent protein translocase protein TatA